MITAQCMFLVIIYIYPGIQGEDLSLFWNGHWNLLPVTHCSACAAIAMNQPTNKAILRIGYTFSSLRCALVFCRWYSVHWILFGEEKAGVYFVYLYSYYEFHIFVSLYFTFCSFVVGTVCHVHRVARKGGRRGYTTCSREGRAPATHTRIHQYNPV